MRPRDQPVRSLPVFEAFELQILHMARDTLPAIEQAGFTVERSERFPFSPGAPVPSIPHILGVAKIRG